MITFDNIKLIFSKLLKKFKKEDDAKKSSHKKILLKFNFITKSNYKID